MRLFLVPFDIVGVEDGLKISTTFSHHLGNMLRSVNRRLAAHIFQQIQRSSSSGPTAALHSDKPDDGVKLPSEPTESKSPTTSKVRGPVVQENETNDGGVNRSKLVSAAFASLKESQPPTLTSTDDLIASARDAETLLAISQTSILTKKQILKIVTLMAEWSVQGKASISKYEADPRFVALCQNLGRSPKRVSALSAAQNEGDLSLVLGVTGDDEAAKMIYSISLPQMIKVLMSLAFKKRRSIPLLRALSFNISRTNAVLDVKQGADILYALCCLNFPDEVLLEKVCFDLADSVPKCQKSSVIGSISTSLGLLKYREENLLETLTEWIIKNVEISRSQDIFSILHAFASVNYRPVAAEEFFKTIDPYLSFKEASSTNAWLNVVWSLSVLEAVNDEQLKSVLNPDFQEKLGTLTSNSSNLSWKRKVLNINGVAKYTKNYKGPILDPTTISLPLVRTKDKQALVASVFDALSNLVPSGTHLKADVDSEMGFLIDGECTMDQKMIPIPLNSVDNESPVTNQKPKRGRKIAVMVWDYHDHTKGKLNLGGSAALSSSLLHKAGYKVFNVSYKDYFAREKLTDRVAYLEKQLKSLAGQE